MSNAKAMWSLKRALHVQTSSRRYRIGNKHFKTINFVGVYWRALKLTLIAPVVGNSFCQRSLVVMLAKPCNAFQTKSFANNFAYWLRHCSIYKRLNLIRHGPNTYSLVCGYKKRPFYANFNPSVTLICVFNSSVLGGTLTKPNSSPLICTLGAVYHAGCTCQIWIKLTH